jgi:putative ABC transport system permease protein
MYYAFDTQDDSAAAMESFMADYTGNIQPQYNYESKQTYMEEFTSYRSMFLMLGGVLCFIIGLVGVLNFLGSILTGIITRRREFAMLEAIGMTGRQLKAMLIWEGLYNTLGAVFLSLALCAATGPMLGSVMGNMFWFFSYRFSVIPVLAVAPLFALLGVLIPLASYHFSSERSIVERLRVE